MVAVAGQVPLAEPVLALEVVKAGTALASIPSTWAVEELEPGLVPEQGPIAKVDLKPVFVASKASHPKHHHQTRFLPHPSEPD